MAKLNLAALPKPAKVALAVVPALIYTLLVVFLVIMPNSRRVEALRKEISEQENEITKAQSMAAKLDVLKEENQRLKQRLKELSEQLPEEKEVSALLRQVSDIGQQTGLRILSWKPGRRRLHESGIVYEVPVTVRVRGSYHRLGEFFSALTRLKRIVNITDINMSSPKMVGTEAELSITFTALTFTAAPEKAMKRKKGRRRRR
jgi:type IV pilus assembly protein PilO